MIDYTGILLRFYTEGEPLYELLTAHSRQVALLARQLCHRLTEGGTPVDTEFVVEAAMLHDIGIVRTNAPSIHCHGAEPYICHGIIGRQMLDGLGLFRHALVCERHTGAGLTAQEIAEQGLPLPHRDMLPLSLEEKAVCYADKFYSKSRIAPAKPIDEVRRQLAKFGSGTIERFNQMAGIFGEPDYDSLDTELKNGGAAAL